LELGISTTETALSKQTFLFFVKLSLLPLSTEADIMLMRLLSWVTVDSRMGEWLVDRFTASIILSHRTRRHLCFLVKYIQPADHSTGSATTALSNAGVKGFFECFDASYND
jgi:hypothetical protein